MRKPLLFAVLLSVLLCLAMVARVSASDRWSDNFSEFEPLALESGYGYDDWTIGKNSSNANVTYSYASADGVLSVAEHVSGIPTATQSLCLARNITIDGETTHMIKFCANNIHNFIVAGVRVLGAGASMLTNYVWEICVSHVDHFVFFQWKNITTTDSVWSAAISAGSWYTFSLTWYSAPNSYHYLLEEEDVDVPLLNGTVTNNLYDDTDLTAIGMDFGGENTVSLGRVQIDYVKNTAGSGGLGVNIGEVVGIMLPLACLGLLTGKMKEWY